MDDPSLFAVKSSKSKKLRKTTRGSHSSIDNATNFRTPPPASQWESSRSSFTQETAWDSPFFKEKQKQQAISSASKPVTETSASFIFPTSKSGLKRPYEIIQEDNDIAYHNDSTTASRQQYYDSPYKIRTADRLIDCDDDEFHYSESHNNMQSSSQLNEFNPVTLLNQATVNLMTTHKSNSTPFKQFNVPFSPATPSNLHSDPPTINSPLLLFERILSEQKDAHHLWRLQHHAAIHGSSKKSGLYKQSPMRIDKSRNDDNDSDTNGQGFLIVRTLEDAIPCLLPKLQNAKCEVVVEEYGARANDISKNRDEETEINAAIQLNTSKAKIMCFWLLEAPNEQEASIEGHSDNFEHHNMMEPLPRGTTLKIWKPWRCLSNRRAKDEVEKILYIVSRWNIISSM